MGSRNQDFKEDFEQVFNGIEQLPELLQLALEMAQKVFSPQQASIYLKDDPQGCFHLELCCGSSPLDLMDQFSSEKEGQGEASFFLPPEVKAGRTGQFVEKAVLNSGREWFRNALPLNFEKNSNSETLGILVLDFPDKPTNEMQEFQELISPIAHCLGEIIDLEKKPNELQSYDLIDSMRMDVILAEALAQELGLEVKEVEEIKAAAYYRDIGYQNFKKDFINKAGPLSPGEREELKKHPLYSEQLLTDMAVPSKVRKLVRQHHESFNGKGYPDGLSRESIQMGARILAVVDTYEALTSERPYRHAFKRLEALEILNFQSGKQFDPDVVSSLPFALIRSRCEPKKSAP